MQCVKKSHLTSLNTRNAAPLQGKVIRKVLFYDDKCLTSLVNRGNVQRLLSRIAL